MTAVVYILPALGWGLMPVLAKRNGGNSYDQLLGTTIGAAVLSVMLTLIMNVKFELPVFLVSLSSGLFWSIGQLLQFKALESSEVSNVMPISTGTQLLFTTFISGIFLSEWHDYQDVLFSVLALLIMFGSVYLMISKKSGFALATKNVTLLICLSSLMLCLYATITPFFKISGVQIFLPQSLGMLLGGVLIFKRKYPLKSVNQSVVKNFSVGLSWWIANISLFYLSSKVGVGISYSLSQLCVFVSIIGGIIFLKERKSAKQILFLGIGICLFATSILILGALKN